MQSEYAFRCVNIVAEDVAGIRHGVRNKVTKQDMPDHLLMQAIRYARVEYKQDLIALWQKSRRVWGETYILPIENDFHFYIAARWLNPLATEPITYMGYLSHFEYQAGGSFETYRPNQIVYDKNDSLLDDLRGQSLIGVALDAINIDREIKRFTLDRFLKDMKWAGIISGRQGSGLQENDLDALLGLLKEQKDSRLIALPQAVEFQRVQQDMDSTHLGVSEDVRRRITTALGIPMSTAGAWDDAKYQSAPAQLLFYYEQVIFRECTRHALFTNDVWLPFYDNSGTAEFYYDTSEVQAKLEDKRLKTEIVTQRVQGATLTVNEGRKMLGDEPLEGGDILLLPAGYTVMPIDRLPQLSNGGSAVPLLPDGMTPTTAMDAVTPPPEPTAQPGMKSVCALLTIGADTDLVGFQQQLRAHFTDIQVKWNEPDSFHVTLAYAPAASEEQVAALVAALEQLVLPDDLRLRVGSLNTFDDLTKYALHFRVPQNSALKDLQAEVYEVFQSAGVAARSTSRPENYKPHITMGYADDKPGSITFKNRVTVEPKALELTVGDEHEVVFSRTFGDEPEPPVSPDTPAQKSHPHDHDLRDMLHNPPHEDALAELAAWKAKVKHAPVKGITAFKTYWIRPEVAESIQAALVEAGNEREAVKVVFANARVLLSYKAAQATRIDFEDEFNDVLQSAIGGGMSKRQWAGKVRNLLKVYGHRAFRDGLAEGGIDDEPDESEQETIARLLSEQSAFVSNLANTLFADETTVSPALAEQKPAMWWNGSVSKFYSEGRLAADGNALYEWVLGATEQHCTTCPQLNGQRKRYKTWYRKNLIAGSVGQDTECEGWRCECKLVRVAGKSSIINLDVLLSEAQAA